MTDHAAEQEMEIEALEAILMDDFKEVEDAATSGLQSDRPCYVITVSPKGDDEDEPTEIPVRLALIFSHTPQYPDEPPLLSIRSIQGMKQAEVDEVKKLIEAEVQSNLGMPMIYTLAAAAKEWMREKYGSNENEFEMEEEEAKEEVIAAHGLPVTVETFLAWRERCEAEVALEQAKLMPEASLGAAKEKRCTGRQWFESGRHQQKGAKGVMVDEEDEEEIDFDDEILDEEDLDEDDMLEHYLAEKAES